MFFRCEQLYLRELIAIPVGSSISFDHTFKVAANIGYSREDGKWVQQYDALFVVMNNAGKILTWQFTKGTTFAEIDMVLKNLKERCQCLSTVYIDDCCKLRNKVQKVFGNNVSVKLDLFHAVQRISRTLAIKCGLHHKCIQDLTHVFRANGDVGKQRQSSTPEPEVMMSKMDAFAKKWESVRDIKGVHVFSSDTVGAIQKLKKHISAGCLSNIPPGGGTNRNERFHHHINSILHRSKVGILLAYALLTVVIHSYNSTYSRHSRTVSEPITCSKFRYDSHLTTPLQPVGILPKERQITDAGSSEWEHDLTTSVVDLHTVKHIFTISFQKLQVIKSVVEMGLVPLTKAVKQFVLYESSSCFSGEVCLNPELVETLQANGLQFTPGSKKTRRNTNLPDWSKEMNAQKPLGE